MKKFLTLSVLVGMSSVAMAKLPAMNDEAKAKDGEQVVEHISFSGSGWQ